MNLICGNAFSKSLIVTFCCLFMNSCANLNNERLYNEEAQMNKPTPIGSSKTNDTRITKWPVEIKLIEWSPQTDSWKYWIEIKIKNSLNRPLLFDKMSIGYNNQISNNLFNVLVNGKVVSYQGMMKDRVQPDADGFVELKPGKEYLGKIELSSDYPIPSGKQTVSIQFEHTNHFSPDDFLMNSQPIIQVFEGSGKKF